jgi:hypothetical protein
VRPHRTRATTFETREEGAVVKSGRQGQRTGFAFVENLGSGPAVPPRPMMNPSTTIPPAGDWRASETLRAGPAVSCGAVRWLSKQPATAGGMAVPDYRQPSPRAPPRARPARLTSDQVVPVRRRRPRWRRRIDEPAAASNRPAGRRPRSLRSPPIMCAVDRGRAPLAMPCK